MSDLIDRQDFDKCIEDAEKEAVKNRKYVLASALNTIRGKLRNFPSARPENAERTAETTQYIPNDDLVSRKAAIDAIANVLTHGQAMECQRRVNALPSARDERWKLTGE